MKSKVKILLSYLLSLTLILFYFHIEKSENIDDLLKKTDVIRTDWAFALNFIIGSIKYISIFCGLLIGIVLTYNLLKQKIFTKK